MDFETKFTGLQEEHNNLLSAIKRKFDTRFDEVDKTLANLRKPPFALPGGLDGRSTPEFRAFDQFLRKGLSAIEPDERKVLVVSDDPSAGYLAPPEVSAEILRIALDYSPLRQIARVVQINRESLEQPKRSGHGTAAWVTEIGTRSETTGLAFSMERLTPYEMYYLAKASLKQLEDSAYPLESEIAAEIGEQVGVLEGGAFISGNGVGKPEGILTNSSVAHVPSGGASTITADALMGMVFQVKSEYAKNATWVMSRATLGEVRKLKDAVSGNYLWQPGFGGQPNLLLGYPYIECSDMPAIGASNEPIAFGDFRRGYMVVDRVGLSIQRLSEKYAENGIVGFLARKRVGGQVVDPTAFVKMRVEAS